MNSGSSSPARSARIAAFALGSSCGLRRTARSSGDSADRGGEVAERLVHLREPARVLRRAEERLGVDAVRDGYADSSSREKSRPSRSPRR